MTIDQLIQQLVTDGGAIVSSGECSEMEIANAQATGRFSVREDGMGFVRRTKEWLALQLAREKATSSEFEAWLKGEEGAECLCGMTEITSRGSRLRECLKLAYHAGGKIQRDQSGENPVTDFSEWFETAPKKFPGPLCPACGNGMHRDTICGDRVWRCDMHDCRHTMPRLKTPENVPTRREPTNEERLQAREAAGKIYKMASLLCDVAGGERKITEAEAAMIKAICDVKP